MTRDTVACPACGIACRLVPLRRAGGYCLVDPDGYGHAAVCPGLEPGSRGRYRRSPDLDGATRSGRPRDPLKAIEQRRIDQIARGIAV